MLQVLHASHLRKKLHNTCESAAAGPAKYFLSSMHKETIPLGGRDQSTDRYGVSKPLYQKSGSGYSLHRFDLLNHQTHLGWWVFPILKGPSVAVTAGKLSSR